MKYLRKLINRLLSLDETYRQFDDLKILIGSSMVQRAAQLDSHCESLGNHEFRVFSEYGEDGIIQYLIRNIDLADHERSFIEFGVQDYSESNTRFLLRHNNWRGLIIDGDPANILKASSQYWFWRHDLTAVSKFLTAENVNTCIKDAGFSGDIGILSVDIDGNYYWLWQAINVVRPAIVICEYNSLFGPSARVTVPYDPKFVRERAHYSGVYFGCSLAALELLAARKGYALVGSNSAGSNAFFVRSDKLSAIKTQSSSTCWRESKFRQSRDQNGKLDLRSQRDAISEVSDKEVIDVFSGQAVKIAHLLDW